RSHLTEPVRRHLIGSVGEHLFRVGEQSADEAGFTVVDTACRGQPQWARHQKYPAFLRPAIAASDSLSSARVAPRAVSLLALTSVMISPSVAVVDSTAPVHESSPRVRYRTVRRSTVSLSHGPPHGLSVSHMPSRRNTGRSWAKYGGARSTSSPAM